jgi:hypothetical protein
MSEGWNSTHSDAGLPGGGDFPGPTRVRTLPSSGLYTAERNLTIMSNTSPNQTDVHSLELSAASGQTIVAVTGSWMLPTNYRANRLYVVSVQCTVDSNTGIPVASIEWLDKTGQTVLDTEVIAWGTSPSPGVWGNTVGQCYGSTVAGVVAYQFVLSWTGPGTAHFMEPHLGLVGGGWGDNSMGGQVTFETVWLGMN